MPKNSKSKNIAKFIFGLIFGYIKKLDKPLFIAVCAVSLFSVLLMYSIYRNEILADKSSRLYIVQFGAVCIGAFAALVMSALDYGKFVKLWYIYAPFAIIITLLTFTPLGDSGYAVSDNRAWIDFGFITLQPSEIMKAAFIMTFALHLYKVRSKINNIVTVATLAAHAAVPLLIVVAQKDDGTAMVFAAIIIAMLFAAGLSWRYILLGLIALPVAAIAVWNLDIMKGYQKNRILVLFADDPMAPEWGGIYYQQYWGKIALGSGEVFGKGLWAEEYVYVPEAHNDFIFTYVGQCFGFIGCIGLIAVLTYICLKIIANSRMAKDDLGKYICMGVYAVIFTHCVLNIGMVLAVLPVIGIPLPFVSQGGSSMLSMFLCIGLVLSVHAHSEKSYNLFYD